MADYTTPIVTILTGLGLGWFAHWLTRKRDTETRQHASQAAKDTRKSNFLAFMEGWRTEIERKSIRVVADQFNDRCAEFRTEAAKIRSDHGPKFWKLVDSLSGLRSGEVEEGSNQGDKAPGRLELLSRFDALVNFVKAN